MRRSILLILCFICLQQFCLAQDFNINVNIAENISKDILLKIKDAKKNLNLRYSDFLVTIHDYNGLELNFSNYDNDFPIIGHHIDYNLHLLDQDHYYFIPLSDTLIIQEEIHLEKIGNKIIQVTSLNEKEKDIHYKVSISVLESIEQRFPLEIDVKEGMEKELKRWVGLSPYVELVDSAQSYFYVPEIETLSNLSQLKQTLALGDTCVLYESELSYTATLIYKGKPAVHWIDGAILRIDRFNLNTLIETKYLKILFAYGC